jgi:hypothetical protein
MLSLVSHEVHDLVKPIAFNTVALNGQNAIWDMYSKWKRAPEGAKPAVLHLLVTNNKDTQTLHARLPAQTETSTLGDDEGFDFEEALDDERVECLAFEGALTDLLPLLAPKLRSIAVIAYGFHSPGTQKLFGNTAFPCLHHVAVNTDFADSMSWMMGPKTSNFGPTMPILTTLEVELHGVPNRLEMIQKFVQACPTIRHVIMGGFVQHVHGKDTPAYLLGRPLAIDADSDSTPIDNDLFSIFSGLHLQGGAAQPPKIPDTSDFLRRNGFDVRIRPGHIEIVEVYPCRRGYSPNAEISGLVVHPRANEPPTYQELRTKWERRMEVSGHPDSCIELVV